MTIFFFIKAFISISWVCLTNGSKIYLILNKLSIFIFLCLLHNGENHIIWIKGGNIYPDKPDPVVPFRNNEGAWSSYTFFLKLSTRIPPNSQGEIWIKFPEIFNPAPGSDAVIYSKNDNPLNGDDPKSVVITRSVYSYYPSFSLLGSDPYTLVIKLDSFELSAGSVSILIKYIKNPKGSSNNGTGNF